MVKPTWVRGLALFALRSRTRFLRRSPSVLAALQGLAASNTSPGQITDRSELETARW